MVEVILELKPSTSDATPAGRLLIQYETGGRKASNLAVPPTPISSTSLDLEFPDLPPLHDGVEKFRKSSVTPALHKLDPFKKIFDELSKVCRFRSETVRYLLVYVSLMYVRSIRLLVWHGVCYLASMGCVRRSLCADIEQYADV